MQLKYRALLGASSNFAYVPFEVGLNFDPFLCVPYIPASSIKGAARAAWRKIREKNLDERFEEKEEDRIFGRGGPDGNVGAIIFSDAFPVKHGKKGFILYPDVITPHYSKGGEDVFDETQAFPTPIPHLSIAPETVFSFVIAIPKRTVDISKEEARRIFRKVLMVTNVALKLGIGARTSVGYGVFELKGLKIYSPR
jgi:CRISPR-associated protein Cmr6